MQECYYTACNSSLCLTWPLPSLPAGLPLKLHPHPKGLSSTGDAEHACFFFLPFFEALSQSVLVAQSCPTLCNPMDCSPPGSSVRGIFEARILSSLFISAQISEYLKYLKVKVLVTQLCPTLCDSMDCSLSGSSVHGIFQARILEWVAISSFRGSSRPRDQTHISRVSCIGR